MCKMKILITLLFFLITVSAYATPVTSEFGWRSQPISGEWKFHKGLDIGYDYGTPVYSFFDGVVCQCGDFDDGYGNQVVIYSYDYDVYIRFAHLSSVTCLAGDTARQGELVGYVGSTGYSTGPHLHLEYIARDENGEYQFFDPSFLLD